MERLLGMRLQWVLDYPYPDFWTAANVAMFFVPAGKRRCGHWSFATEESKAAVRMTFPERYDAFSIKYRI